MPETLSLSEAALALFRLHVERQGQIPIDDSTRSRTASWPAPA